MKIDYTLNSGIEVITTLQSIEPNSLALHGFKFWLPDVANAICGKPSPTENTPDRGAVATCVVTCVATCVSGTLDRATAMLHTILSSTFLSVIVRAARAR